MSCNPDASLDPRIRRTRKLLQDALSALLQEKEFGDISVQDITARATVNRATFYAHYKDKQELAVSILRTRLHHAMYQRFEERPALTHENIITIAVAIFEFFHLMYDRCPKTGADLQAVSGTVLHDDIYEMMIKWITQSPQYRQLFPGCTKEAVATVLAGSIYTGAQYWARAKNHSSAITLCQEIVRLILPGRELNYTKIDH